MCPAPSRQLIDDSGRIRFNQTRAAGLNVKRLNYAAHQHARHVNALKSLLVTRPIPEPGFALSVTHKANSSSRTYNLVVRCTYFLWAMGKERE